MDLPSTEDTIVALSSPLGGSAVALVRVSGPRARELAETELRFGADVDVQSTPGFRQLLACVDFNGVVVDVRVSVYRQPNSFTGEDLVECRIPGSVPFVAVFLRRLLSSTDPGGSRIARRAQPGEFTLRAFLNGKMDLTQVEAIGRLLHAGGEAEARAAYRQVGGALGDRLQALVGKVVEALALVESGIDFVDEEIPAVSPQALAERIDECVEDLSELLGHTALRIPEQGAFRVALVGAPNAGKSSLLNAVSGAPVALVSGDAGTTRDPVRVVIRSDDLHIEWVDLAGFESTAWSLDESATGDAQDLTSVIERISRRELESADVVLWLADPQEPIPLSGYLSLVVPAKLLVLSKCDLLDVPTRRRLGDEYPDASLVSSRTGEGLVALLNRLKSIVVGDAKSDGPAPESAVLISALQEIQLEQCREALRRAQGVALGGSPELAAIDLRDAIDTLERFSGAEVAESVLGTIFQQFCVGK